MASESLFASTPSLHALSVTYSTQAAKALRHASVHGTITKQGISIGRVAKGYALPKSFAIRLFKVPPHTEGYDGYVHVVGTFRYKDLTPAPTPKPKKVTKPTTPRTEMDAERIVVEQKNGFGWWGLYDKTITDMTECLPLGPPVPSGL